MTRLARSVGLAVQSHKPDVKYVQFLLNDWRHSKGGQLLKVDGIVGPLTNAAIREFQRAETGRVDGQVDRDGPTIRKLEYLHIARIASGVSPLEHYGMMSLTPPPHGPVTFSLQSSRYLSALRHSQG